MQVTKDTNIAVLPVVKIGKFWLWECNGTCSQEEEDLWKTRMVQSELIYTSGSKVYYWVIDSFYLLYDFDLLPGDVYVVYARNGLLYPEENIYFPVLILDTVSIIVDGTRLRGQRFWNYESVFDYRASGYYFTGWAYEKLGKDDYLFPFNGGDMDIFGNSDHQIDLFFQRPKPILRIFLKGILMCRILNKSRIRQGCNKRN